MIPFNKPCLIGGEQENLHQCIANQKFSGDGPFSKKCHEFFEQLYQVPRALLTTSCTDALELSALLIDIRPGDEVIMPSFTFVSTANAFALRGAKIIFVDIEPTSMTMDLNCVAAAITPKTKAIVPVHYAGWSCDMDKLMALAQENKLHVIEDAAQAIGAKFKGKLLGTFGQFSTLSFHETKNVQCGEGGVLLLGDPAYIPQAEIHREKGTNRSMFHRGQADKYTWVDLGSSFLPSELNAAFLLPQLEKFTEINRRRVEIWNAYHTFFSSARLPELELLTPPPHSEHNGHLFAIKAKDLATRNALIQHLGQNGILAPFHYVPLHSAPGGLRHGEFRGTDKYTTRESERLLRLPLFYSLTDQEIEYICAKVLEFYN
jgi:dTDP-4-amino-4,6-dideoxygalactose transaminase